MARSKYLDSLTPPQRDELKKMLYEKQGHKCFICEDEIDMSLQKLDIDHVIPLALEGKDEPNNFALTHFDCNREKQDSLLYVVRCMKRFDKIKEEVYKKTGKSPNLSDLLARFGGAKSELPFEISDRSIDSTFPRNFG